MINSVSFTSVPNIYKADNGKSLAITQEANVVENSSQKINNQAYYGKDLVNNVKPFSLVDVNPSQMNEIFARIKDKNGKEFAEAAYHEIVKYMGLDSSAPKQIVWEKNEGRPIIGDYRFYDNSIVFYTDYFLKQDKASQLATIAHELTHCKQLVNMFTTEGISVEQIAYSYAVSDLRAMLVRNPKVISMHQQAKQQGKEKEFIQMMIQAGTVKTTKELREAHTETLKLPKHSLNSPEGLEAQAALKAQFNYNGADMVAYNNCPLEKQAMAIENVFKQSFNSYLKNA